MGCTRVTLSFCSATERICLPRSEPTASTTWARRFRTRSLSRSIESWSWAIPHLSDLGWPDEKMPSVKFWRACSEQIWVARFLATRGWRLEPDLVVVYCGNNDASISGAVSDATLMGRQRTKGLH